MLTLTTPIAIPNLQRVHVDAVLLDGNSLVGTVQCSVLGAGALVYSIVALQIRDGRSQGLRANPAPVGYTDRVQIFDVDTPTLFTDLVTASTGNMVTRNRNAETVLQAAGCLPAGVIT